MPDNYTIEKGSRITFKCNCGKSIDYYRDEGMQVLSIHRIRQVDFNEKNSNHVKCKGEHCNRTYRIELIPGEKSANYLHPVEYLVIKLSGRWKPIEPIICFTVSIFLLTVVPLLILNLTGYERYTPHDWHLAGGILCGACIFSMMKALRNLKIVTGQLELDIHKDYYILTDKGYSFIYAPSLYLLVMASVAAISFFSYQLQPEMSEFGFTFYLMSAPYLALEVSLFCHLIIGYMFYVQSLTGIKWKIKKYDDNGARIPKNVSGTKIKNKIESLFTASYIVLAVITLVIMMVDFNWTVFGNEEHQLLKPITVWSHIAYAALFIIPGIIIFSFNTTLNRDYDRWIGEYKDVDPEYVLINISGMGKDSHVQVERTDPNIRLSTTVESLVIRQELEKEAEELDKFGIEARLSTPERIVEKCHSDQKTKFSTTILHIGQQLRSHYFKERSVESALNVQDAGDNLYVCLNVSGEDSKLMWEILSLDTCEGKNITTAHKYLSLSANVYRTRKLLDVKKEMTLNIRKVLLVESNASNSSVARPLTLQKEVEAVTKSLQELGIVVVNIKGDDVTEKAFEDRVRSKEFQAIHFCGHSTADSKGQDGHLLFSKDHPYSIFDFLNLFSEGTHGIQLVYLSSCLSAAKVQYLGGPELISLADALAISEVPYVIGMQRVISNDGASVLAHHFYNSIKKDGIRPELALKIARQNVKKECPWDPAWTAPVLIKG